MKKHITSTHRTIIISIIFFIISIFLPWNNRTIAQETDIPLVCEQGAIDVAGFILSENKCEIQIGRTIDYTEYLADQIIIAMTNMIIETEREIRASEEMIDLINQCGVENCAPDCRNEIECDACNCRGCNTDEEVNPGECSDACNNLNCNDDETCCCKTSSSSYLPSKNYAALIPKAYAQSFGSTIVYPDAGSWQSDDFWVQVNDGSDCNACRYHVYDSDNGWTASWGERPCNAWFSIDVGSTGDCQTEGENKCQVHAFCQDIDTNISASNIRTFSIGSPPPPPPPPPSGDISITSLTTTTFPIIPNARIDFRINVSVDNFQAGNNIAYDIECDTSDGECLSDGNNCDGYYDGENDTSWDTSNEGWIGGGCTYSTPGIHTVGIRAALEEYHGGPVIDVEIRTITVDVSCDCRCQPKCDWGANELLTPDECTQPESSECESLVCLPPKPFCCCTLKNVCNAYECAGEPCPPEIDSKLDEIEDAADSVYAHYQDLISPWQKLNSTEIPTRIKKIREQMGECIVRPYESEAYLRGEKTGKWLFSCKTLMNAFLPIYSDLDEDHFLDQGCYGNYYCKMKYEQGEESDLLYPPPCAENFYCCIFGK